MTASAPGQAGITILGSTGSIGTSTLDVVARHPQRFRVVALTANASVERLAEQCVRYRPDYAVMADAAAAGATGATPATYGAGDRGAVRHRQPGPGRGAGQR